MRRVGYKAWDGAGPPMADARATFISVSIAWRSRSAKNHSADRSLRARVGLCPNRMSEKRIQVIQRAVHIMEFVGNAPRGLRLSQVAHTLNMPKQTVYKIMDTLVAEGLLTKAGHRPVYRLSRLMSGLRMQQQSWNQTFLPRAAPVAHRISMRCDCQVMISQYAGGEVLGRARFDPRQPDAELVCFTGNMCAYGTGMVFQAHMDSEELEAFRRAHPLAIHDRAGYWKSYRMVDEAIARIRREGYLAMLKSEVIRAIVPVPREGSGLWGAFTLLKEGAFCTGGCPVARWISIAREAADGLAASLAGGKDSSKEHVLAVGAAPPRGGRRPF
jgi:DNA-binding IclR family transcriptional regulator